MKQLHQHGTTSPSPLASYSVRSPDGRVVATVHPGRPTCVYVTHANISDGAIDAALMDMALHIPSPCHIIIVPDLSGPWLRSHQNENGVL